MEDAFKGLELLVNRDGTKKLEDLLDYNVAQYTKLRNTSVDETLHAKFKFYKCCMDGLERLVRLLPLQTNHILSVNQQNLTVEVLEFVVGFGVQEFCDPGVCPLFSIKEVEGYLTSYGDCNAELEKVITLLSSYLEDNTFNSAIISKFLGIFLVACIQVLYGPNNPSRVIKLNKDPDEVRKSTLINVTFIKATLDTLCYKTPTTIVVQQLVLLQLPKGKVKAPRWLVAVTSDLLSLQVTRTNGVMNVSRALFEQHTTGYEDQELCDKISGILTIPPKTCNSSYTTNILQQTRDIIHIRNPTLRHQMSRLYKNLVHKLSSKYPEESLDIIWSRDLFRPFHWWCTYDGEPNRVIIPETEFDDCISTLHIVSQMGLFYGHLSDKICTSYLYSMLVLYNKTFNSLYRFKLKIKDTIQELVSVSTEWTGCVLDFLSGNDETRAVKFAFGDGGGVQLIHDTHVSSDDICLDPNQLLSVADNRVEVVLSVINDKTPFLPSFFIRIFTDVVSIEDDTSSTEMSSGTTSFLECRDELGEIKGALRKGYLLDKMLGKYGDKMLTNTTETIQLISVIIDKRSKQAEVYADDVLLTSFKILSTYLSHDGGREILLSDADHQLLNKLLPPLLHIANSSRDQSITDLSNDLRIAIATKIKVAGLKGFVKVFDKKIKLSDILRDLADPMIPSRAHAIVQLGKLAAEKDDVVTGNIDILQDIVLDNISHQDTYIFLACVRCLTLMSWHHTSRVVEVLCGEVIRPERKVEDRIKCMEALVKVVSLTNELVPAYKDRLLDTLLACVNNPCHQTEDDRYTIMLSALSAIAEVYQHSKYTSNSHLQEIIQTCESILMVDKDVLAKKSSLFLLRTILKAHEMDLFQQIEKDILRLYRLLKKVARTQSDVQEESLSVLGVLSDIVREFMFPKTLITHDVKIM